MEQGQQEPQGQQDYSLLDFLKTFGISSTTNFDLYSIANFLDLNLEIYMKNEKFNISNSMKIHKQRNYIFNYQNSYENGSHWTCYSKGYYFDSFGLKPLKQLEKHTKIYNKIQVQHFGIRICGILCIYFFIKKQEFGSIISEMLSLYNSLLINS